MAPTTVPLARLVRAAAAAALIALVGVALAAPAAAQTYPPAPEIVVTTPNATIIIEGNDWGPGTTVTITYGSPTAQASDVAATAVADGDGAFTAEVRIPADAELGAMTLAVRGTGSDGAPREDNPTVQVVSPDDRTAGEAGTSTNPSGASTDVASGRAATGATPPAAVTAASSLPTTGALPGSLLLLAAVLLAAGLGSLLVARVHARR